MSFEMTFLANFGVRSPASYSRSFFMIVGWGLVEQSPLDGHVLEALLVFVYVILLITTPVLGFVATVLWGPGIEWLGHDVEAAYTFKLVAIGLVVFFLIAITFGLI